MRDKIQQVMDSFKETTDIMQRVSWPFGGGSYMISGQNLEYNEVAYPKQELLMKTVSRFGEYTTILEIGFYAGHSALLMAAACPTASITAIDPCCYGFEEECMGVVSKRCLDAGLLVGTSREVLPKLDPELTFDVIHIDGCHDIDDVIFDIECCRNFASQDTLVVIDDWDGIEPQLPICVLDKIEIIEVADCPNPCAIIRYK